MNVTTDGFGLTYKQARTANEQRRLEHEAAVLRRVAHPGVVQLLDTQGASPPEALVLRTVRGGDLTALGAQPTPVIAGLGAALATTVADLHALGYSHGGIEASHVLLDEAGRPVLCSLSRSHATATSPDAERLRDEDLRALAVLLLQLLAPGGSGRVARTLRDIATPTRRRPRRDASWLARHLISAVPDARLPGPDRDSTSTTDSAHQLPEPPADRAHHQLPEPGRDRALTTDTALHQLPEPDRAGTPATAITHRRPRGSRSHRRIRPGPRSRLVTGGVGLCIVVASSAVLAGWATAAAPSRAHRPGQAAAPCPVVDHGCVPIAGHGGVLVEPMGRYQVGRPGDVVVMGRWGCGGTAFPAVLRPGTGDVWSFNSWPTADDPVVGRLVGHVGLAWSLRVRPGRSGCDQLEIDRRDLPPVTIVGVAR